MAKSRKKAGSPKKILRILQEPAIGSDWNARCSGHLRRDAPAAREELGLPAHPTEHTGRGRGLGA
jgi:hypothetical protein